MKSNPLFKLLTEVDSTNNYAMAMIHEGLAINGMAWHAHTQLMGKGQRGKYWASDPGKNILLSMAIQSPSQFSSFPFLFNAFITGHIRQFLENISHQKVAIKWPNDLYINDRKAGGLLLENIFQGKEWKWSVIGMGININQESFPDDLSNPVSLKQLSGKEYEVEELSRQLHLHLLGIIETTKQADFSAILKNYNLHLYKRGEWVTLRKQEEVFQTKIESVTEKGRLITSDSILREFEWGEIEWLLKE